jgi:hypothetical protein
MERRYERVQSRKDQNWNVDRTQVENKWFATI